MKSLLLILCILLITNCFAQVSSRNGYYFTCKGEFEILYVFAEVTGDPNYNIDSDDWPAGQLPNNPETYFDTGYININNANGEITKKFHYSSYGEFKLIGDYIDSLIQIPYSQINGSNANLVINDLNGFPGSDITTARGLSVVNDFDNWTTTQYGLAKQNTGDGKIDLVVILWRVNSIYTTDLAAGFVADWSNSPLKGMSQNAHSVFRSIDKDYGIFTHEFSHTILGDNNIHSQQGGGDNRKLLSTTGGFNLVASAPKTGNVVCGWNRHRLGWKNSSKDSLISAQNLSGSEVYADFDVNPGISSIDLILRDFITYGDIVRIKLPHLDSNKLNQYLWLENHQHIEFSADISSNIPSGIQAYYQIGHDDTSNLYRQSLDDVGNNYLTFLNSFGKYDLDIPLTNDSIFKQNFIDSNANPLTGHLMLSNFVFDFNNDGEIKSNEHQSFGSANYVNWDSAQFYINGNPMPRDSFNVKVRPAWGSVWDPFEIGDKIGVAEKNTATTLLTWKTALYKSTIDVDPESHDNRKIHLNGISVEILDEITNAEGNGKDLKVKIRWNDYDINKNRDIAALFICMTAFS